MAEKELKVLEEIATEIKGLKGHFGFCYKNLVTGLEYGMGAEEVFSAASVIKLPLFLHLLGECHRGNMSLDEVIVTKDGEKVPSCGAVNMMGGDVALDIRTLCRFMICLSDNTATNTLLRRCGLDGVEKGFVAMGLEKTKIRRLLFDSAAAGQGMRNTLCPRELIGLLERLYRGEYVNENISKYAIDVLCEQQINHKLGGRLTDAVTIAHKTGEDDGLSHDVGIVYAPQPFAVCFAGEDTDVYLWEDLIRRSGYKLYCAQEG